MTIFNQFVYNPIKSALRSVSSYANQIAGPTVSYLGKGVKWVTVNNELAKAGTLTFLFAGLATYSAWKTLTPLTDRKSWIKVQANYKPKQTLVPDLRNLQEIFAAADPSAPKPPEDKDQPFNHPYAMGFKIVKDPEWSVKLPLIGSKVILSPRKIPFTNGTLITDSMKMKEAFRSAGMWSMILTGSVLGGMETARKLVPDENEITKFLGPFLSWVAYGIGKPAQMGASVVGYSMGLIANNRIANAIGNVAAIGALGYGAIYSLQKMSTVWFNVSPNATETTFQRRTFIRDMALLTASIASFSTAILLVDKNLSGR